LPAHADRVATRCAPAGSGAGRRGSNRRSCLGSRWRENRLDLLRYGVDVISQPPTPRSTSRRASDREPAHRTAARLRYIGIHKLRGFMLNVTHYAWTLANIRHRLKISGQVGGKPFIINTATNDRGPVH
jgi:endoglucanase